MEQISTPYKAANPRNYCFVVPRFGDDIAGGAESLVRELAINLAARGDGVTIFSTCAHDNRTWENFYPAGKTIESGIVVQRFPVDSRDLEKWVPLQIRISDGMELSLDEQLDWMEHSVNSSALYNELNRRSSEFSLIFFAPYLFGTTFFGSLIAPEKSCLIPCLHDEHYAYLDIIQAMFRMVRGCVFNTQPEMELANRLYGKINGGEVGMGFSLDIINDLFPYFKENFPYVLCLGRKETGKNVQLLIDLFITAKDNELISNEIKLVICGGGDFKDLGRNHVLERGDIIDIAHVSQNDKERLLSASLALAQPSTNESFSIVLMEAWRRGTPVIVHSDCAVTKQHAIVSGGGLYFKDVGDLAGIINQLAKDKLLRDRLGASGREYIKDYYNWDAVLARFDQVMQDFSI